MGRVAATGTASGANTGDRMIKKPTHTLATGTAALLLIVGWSCIVIQSAHSQSGRQKNTNAKPSPTPAGPRQATRSMPPPPVMPQKSANSNSSDGVNSSDDVVRVASHLVPVPTTVLDSHGAAIINLKLEDFELVVDGETKPINEI